ncbi:MAG: tetratricopeptide repeat protein [Deltaproteobacteria bacterium]|nr:tetratricopeptide repeat protein [Deltaproteobacteria bacterium]
MNAALELHQAGHLEEAKAVYEKILKYNPEHADALHLLGLVHHQNGKNDVALSFIGKAIELDRNRPVFYHSLGNTYHELNLIDEAINSYQKAIQLEPHYAEAFFSLASLFHCNQKIPEAINCFQKAIQFNPEFAEAYYFLGNLLQNQKMLNEAIRCYQKAVELQPGMAKAYGNMGNAFLHRGKHEEAIRCYEKATYLNPQLAEVFSNLGSAHQELGQTDKSLDCYEKAIHLNPDYAEAFNNMGNVFESTGKLSEAAASYRKAIELKPDFSDAYANMGSVFKAQGNIARAMEYYKKAIIIRPDYHRAHSNLLFAMHYDPSSTPEVIFSESLAWWKQHGNAVMNKFEHNRRRVATKRLRIGYVSPDFRRHSVGYFVLPLLSAHDRNALEVFCYSEVKRPDPMTARLKDLGHHWRSTVGLGDDVAARLIHDDRIDILVDLAGHTANSRLLVFARKPAPVQVTWLGYPGTTGMSNIDYRITDEIADPSGSEDKFYSETLCRLKDGFLCYAPPEDAPNIKPLPALGSGNITFGSFNNLPKVNEGVIELWSAILSQVPGTSLLLKSKPLADASTRDRFLSRFVKHGANPDQIKMLPASPSTREHLDLYNKVDIGLDPFPYNGTTTTCEALWMGVPVVTLHGNHHAARVGTSILTRVGLEECIAKNKQEYIKKAAILAGNVDRLTALRSGMRKRMFDSPLCQSKLFAKAVETAYRHIWKTYCEK